VNKPLGKIKDDANGKHDQDDPGNGHTSDRTGRARLRVAFVLGGSARDSYGGLMRLGTRPVIAMFGFVVLLGGCGDSGSQASDESTVRDLVTRWGKAVESGDGPTVCALQTSSTNGIQKLGQHKDVNNAKRALTALRQGRPGLVTRASGLTERDLRQRLAEARQKPCEDHPRDSIRRWEVQTVTVEGDEAVAKTSVLYLRSAASPVQQKGDRIAFPVRVLREDGEWKVDGPILPSIPAD
jgi:hypothetical protein